jgi:hypothetical protein
MTLDPNQERFEVLYAIQTVVWKFPSTHLIPEHTYNIPQKSRSTTSFVLPYAGTTNDTLLGTFSLNTLIPGSISQRSFLPLLGLFFPTFGFLGRVKRS